MLCCTNSVCLAKHLSVVNVRWVSFNDEKASVMLSGEVKKTQALMLLYIQRDSIKRVVPQSSQAESTSKKSRSK